MDYLNKNLKKFPELKNIFSNTQGLDNDYFHETKDGKLTVKINGKTLHSIYDPIGEAKRLISTYNIDDAPIIVIGFGLGYHVRALVQKNPDRRVLIVERNIPLLKSAFERLDFSELDSKIRFYLEDDPQEIISEYEFYNALSKKPTIIVHKASTYSFIKFYQNLTDSILSFNQFSVKKKLKITVVSPIMGGSETIAKFTRESFKGLGVEVDYIDNTLHFKEYDSINNNACSKEDKLSAKDIFFRFLTDSIEQRINAFKPDLVFSLAQAPMSVRLLNKLNRMGIKTAFWFVENFRHLTYWRYMAPYYDYFFTIQKGEFFEILERIGARNYYYLPMGFAENIHIDNDINQFNYDISIVATGYGNRKLFVENVLSIEPTLKLSIFGNDWDLTSQAFSCVKNSGKRLSIEEMNRIYKSSKIVLNLHSSSNSTESIPVFDKDYLNPRTFELAAMGVFQLVDHREIISDFFEVGKEIITFNSEKDFIEKAKYYLHNDLERNEIALRARTRVLKEHSYTNRLTSMLTRIFGIGVLKSLESNELSIFSEKTHTPQDRKNLRSEDFNREIAIEKMGLEILKEQAKSLK